MSIEKRISKLEAATPNKSMPSGLGAYYAWERSEEGQTALAELYGCEEENKKMTEEYHKDLRERGLL